MRRLKIYTPVIRAILPIALILSVFTSAYARIDYGISQSVVGNGNTIGTSFSYYDDKLYPLGTFGGSLANIYNRQSVNTIELGVDLQQNLHYVGAAFTAEFSITIQGKDDNNTPLPAINTILKVDYDPANNSTYTDKAVYRFKEYSGVSGNTGSYHTIVTITDIKINGVSLNIGSPNSPYLNVLYLKGSLYVERYVTNFNENQVYAEVIHAPQYLSSSNEIKIEWDEIDGAEEYDLEWTYIDDYTYDAQTQTAGTLAENQVFFNLDNTSRVTLTTTSYQIPNIFDKGFIVFRVRGVGRKGPDYNYRVEGMWTTDGYTNSLSWGTPHNVEGYKIWMCSHYSTYTPTFPTGSFCLGGGSVATGTFPGIYYNATPHQEEKNWQFSATYAEEGKKKETISYFDGSLRSRQTVTTSTVNNYKTSIIAETYYDYQGRPAVQVMPSPNPDQGSVLRLDYFAHFNQNNSSQDYSKSDFDKDYQCGGTMPQPGGMSTASGASRYYSPDNPGLDNTSPYYNLNSQPQQSYVPDAEGRPFTQTVYMPDNTGRIKMQGGVGDELGIGSGHETRYMYGAPFQEELDRLFGAEVGYATNYKMKAVIDPNGQVSVSYTDQADRVIATALSGATPANLQDISGNQATLTVDFLNRNKLSDDGKSLIVTYPVLVTADGNRKFFYHLEGSQYSELCVCFDCVYDVSISIKDECGTELVPAGTGSMTMNGLAALNASCTADAEFDLQSENPPGIINNFLELPMQVGTYWVTKTLTVNESALDYYTDQYITQRTNSSDPQCQIYDYGHFLNLELSKIDYTDCPEETSTDGVMPDRCQMLYDMMLADFMPGGQYAQYTFDPSQPQGLQKTSDFSYSVLNDANKLKGGLDASWRDPVTPYLDENGVVDIITLPDGNQYLPENLPYVEDFINYFKPSWAASLVPYHPEYCYYQWCSASSVSNSTNFDIALMGMDYDDAVMAGYISGGTVNIYSSDPFFQSGGAGYNPSFQNAMLAGVSAWSNRHGIFNYVKDQNGNSLSLAEFVARLVKSVIYGESSLGSSNPLFSSPCTNAMEWEMYRNIYLAEKNRVVELAITTQISSTCRNLHNLIGSQKCVDANNEVLSSSDPQCDKFEYKTKRFYLNSDINSEMDVNAFETGNDTKYDWQNKATQGIADHCNSQCESYRYIWEEELSGCGLNQAQMKTVLDGLVSICKQGCDEANPLGARTSKTGAVSFKSFLDTQITPSESCNETLISMPGSYNHNYFGGNAPLPYLDACGCEKILEIDDEFFGLPDEDKALQFSLRYGGYLIDDFTGMACLCRNAYQQSGSAWNGSSPVWTESALKFLEQRKITVDPVLTCNRCVTCESMMSAVRDFHAEYSYMIGSSNYDKALTNYLNYTLGFNYITSDYLLQIEECNRALAPVCNHQVTTLDYIEAFFNDMTAQANNPVWLSKSSHDISAMTSWDNLLNTAVPCSSYTSVYTTDSFELNDSGDIYDETLVATISNSAGCAFSCKLTLVAEYAIDWSKIDFFSTIVPQNTNPGSNYGFMMDAHMAGSGEIVRITGSSTCFLTSTCAPEDATICVSLSSGPYQVPPDVDDVPGEQQVPVHPQDGTDPSIQLDKCGCNKLYSLQMAWLYSASPEPTESIESYISRKLGYNFTERELLRLFKACDQAYKVVAANEPTPRYPADLWMKSGGNWLFDDNNNVDYIITTSGSVHGTFDTALFSQTLFSMHVPAPAILTCGYCKNCSDLEKAVTAFNTNAFRSTGTAFYLTGTKRYDKALEKYLRAKLPESSFSVFTGTGNSTVCNTCTVKEMSICDGDSAVASGVKDLFFNRIGNQLFNYAVLDDEMPATPPISPALGQVPCNHPGYLLQYGFVPGSTSGSPSNTIDMVLYDNCNPAFVCSLTITCPEAVIYEGMAIDKIYNDYFIPGGGTRGPANSFKIKVDIQGKPYIMTVTSSCWSFGTCCPMALACNKPALGSDYINVNKCHEDKEKLAAFHAQKAYQRYIDSLEASFRSNYIAHCMASATEILNMEYLLTEKQYTLYYYDQAGNLVKTVPPAGVNPIDINNASVKAIVAADRAGNTITYPNQPQHTLVTNYRYNTLNAAIEQFTPDGNVSTFWYDYLGRIAISQDARQDANKPTGSYTRGIDYVYTKYDPLGRIIESGKITQPGINDYMTRLISHDPMALNQWLNNVNASYFELIHTYYDNPINATVNNEFGANGQENLRNRVASVTYTENGSSLTYDYASHFSYDILGNAVVLLQENRILSTIGHNFKRFDYVYDVIGGKLIELQYQANKNDQFLHKYEYDNDSRFLKVFTSRDGVIWEEADATYKYYLHGLLARLELGEKKVQGIDYAYTLNRWIKGVNSNTLKTDRDMGKDGQNSAVNQWFAQDEYGFTLSYFYGDYSQIDATQPNFEAGLGNGIAGNCALNDASESLFNGNIRHMVTAIRKFMQGAVSGPMATAYGYDQLNRLKEVSVYEMTSASDITNNLWPSSGGFNAKYNTLYTYDGNGNIQSLVRNGDGTVNPLQMDNFFYHYYANTNKLEYVDDDISYSGNYTDDIDDQSAGNYEYDASGNLIKDAQANIASIEWTVAGKVKRVIKTPGNGPDLEFFYGPDGNRIAKIVKNGSGAADWKYTYYVRDAQGNVMAVYERELTEVQRSQSDYPDVINELINVLNGSGNGTQLYKDFVHNQYCGATWFTQQMKNEIIVSGNAGNIFVQYGSVWLANNDAGLKGMVTGAYTDNQMGQAVMNTQPQIVIDFIFQTGMNTTGLIQYFINLNCIDFLNKLYMVDPASIQQLYNVFFPGAPPTPVPQMINDLCTMVPAPSLANEVNNYNTMMGGFICPQVLYMYNGTDLYNSIIATYGSFTPFRPQMEVQPNIVDILYIYDPTGVDAIVYSQPDVFLMDIIANNDPCGMIQKALDIDINLALLTFMNGGYDINLFLSDINSYFGPAVHQAVLQAVYGSTAVGNLQEKLTLNELHIYGRNRVGILNANQQLEDWDYDGTLDQNTGQTTVTTLYASVSATISTTEFSRTLGQKSYELTNHLGNVLVTVSDRTIAMDDNTDGTIDYYLADVSTAQDYYAFGAPLPERKFEAPGLKYRYGFNGYEKDDDIKGEGNSYDFGARIQDPRLGRFLSIDPMSPKFPSTSPYSFAANTPIAAKDVNGEFAHLIIKYGIDVGINIATQMLTAYLFDDDVNSVSDAWDEVSLWQAFTEGAVDQLGTKKIRMAANATMQMFTYIDQVGMENATMEGMIMAGGMGLLEPIIGDAIAKYGNKAVAAGLKKANIDAGTIKKFTGFDVTRSRIQGVKPTFGGPLRAADGKTTTLLGVYATDMKRIIANNDVITGENAGGFNVLNIKDWTETKNMEWLQKAIDRGDVIRLVSDPAKATGTYKKELDYLVKHGYEIVGNEARKKVK